MAEELFFWQCTANSDKQSIYVLAAASAVPDVVQKIWDVTVFGPALPLYDADALAAGSWLGFQPEIRLAIRRAQLGVNDPQYQQFFASAKTEPDPAKAAALRAQVMLRGSYLIAVADGVQADIAQDTLLLAQASVGVAQ